MVLPLLGLAALAGGMATGSHFGQDWMRRRQEREQAQKLSQQMGGIMNMAVDPVTGQINQQSLARGLMGSGNEALTGQGLNMFQNMMKAQAAQQQVQANQQFQIQLADHNSKRDFLEQAQLADLNAGIAMDQSKYTQQLGMEMEVFKQNLAALNPTMSEAQLNQAIKFNERSAAIDKRIEGLTTLMNYADTLDIGDRLQGADRTNAERIINMMAFADAKAADPRSTVRPEELATFREPYEGVLDLWTTSSTAKASLEKIRAEALAEKDRFMTELSIYQQGGSRVPYNVDVTPTGNNVPRSNQPPTPGARSLGSY